MKKLFWKGDRCTEAVILGKGDTTVLFFHGFGSSAAALPPDERLLTQNGLQLLCINRPGVGNSTLEKRYTVASVIAEAKAILEQLGISACIVAGWSAGGLFAQAFAQAYPERVLSLHLICSVLPFANKDARKVLPCRWKTICFLNHYFPFVAKAVFKNIGTKVNKYPDGLLQQSISEMEAADKDVAHNGRYYPLLKQAAVEAFAHDGKAVLAEAKALVKTTIAYGRITCPAHIWSGEQDKVWPSATARYLHNKLPGSEWHICRHSGHLLYLKEWEKIAAMFARQQAPTVHRFAG